ncbi:MAG: YbjN domain-containing protein [Leptolyngbyaceae cyanobacterium]
MAGNGRIYAAIEKFLTEDGWTFSQLGDDSIIELRVSGDDGGVWTSLAQAREAEEQMVFYSLFPSRVPEENRMDMAELITRINYGMVLCNFELDLDSGDLRCKTAIDVENHELADELIRQVVYANIMVMEKYLPALAATQSGLLNAQMALELVGE